MAQKPKKMTQAELEAHINAKSKLSPEQKSKLKALEKKKLEKLRRLGKSADIFKDDASKDRAEKSKATKEAMDIAKEKREIRRSSSSADSRLLEKSRSNARKRELANEQRDNRKAYMKTKESKETYTKDPKAASKIVDQMGKGRAKLHKNKEEQKKISEYQKVLDDPKASEAQRLKAFKKRAGYKN